MIFKNVLVYLVIIVLINFTTSFIQRNNNLGIIDYDEEICCLPNGTHFRRSQIPSIGSRVVNKTDLVIFIPSMVRKNPDGTRKIYILETLKSLLIPIKDSKEISVRILVFLNDKEEHVKYIIEQISFMFDYELKEGYIEIIYLTDDFFERGILPPNTFNDPDSHVRWRSKQNLDYSFFFAYSADISTYTLQLEDDVIADSHFLDILKKYIQECRYASWFHLKFSEYFGDIGIMYHSYDMDKLSLLHRIFYMELPCDMMKNQFFLNIYHNSQKERIKKVNCLKPVVSIKLFMHMGTVSSLKRFKKEIGT